MNHSVRLLNAPYNAWIHIFAEARVYQAPNLPMRFFKMGISKLILEPDRTPIVIPMFHSGMEKVMAEGKVPPQFLPSVGQEIRVKFGEPMDLAGLEEFRARWDEVKMHPAKGDVRALRIETAEKVREAVNEVRTSMGFPPEPPGSNDPKSFPHDLPPPSRKHVKKWLSWWTKQKC
jgi:monolysocardiolipin acyltransferase